MKDVSCTGYSRSSYGNCMLWIQGPIDDIPAEEPWGNAHCLEKNSILFILLMCIPKFLICFWKFLSKFEN
jgi:hypothetical protein